MVQLPRHKRLSALGLIAVTNFGFFILPGSDEIYNYKTGEWDKFDEIIHSPFMAYGGWVSSVPSSSQVQDCAWDYVAWYASPENSMKSCALLQL